VRRLTAVQDRLLILADADAWQAALTQTNVDLQVRDGSRPRTHRGGTSEYLRHAVPTRGAGKKRVTSRIRC
jgi:hypothetical protein